MRVRVFIDISPRCPVIVCAVGGLPPRRRPISPPPVCRSSARDLIRACSESASPVLTVTTKVRTAGSGDGWSPGRIVFAAAPSGRYATESCRTSWMRSTPTVSAASTLASKATDSPRSQATMRALLLPHGRRGDVDLRSAATAIFLLLVAVRRVRWRLARDGLLLPLLGSRTALLRWRPMLRHRLRRRALWRAALDRSTVFTQRVARTRHGRGLPGMCRTTGLRRRLLCRRIRE